MRKKVVVTLHCKICDKPFPTEKKCLKHEADCDGLGNIKFIRNYDLKDDQIKKRIVKWLKRQIPQENWQEPFVSSPIRWVKEGFLEKVGGAEGLIKIADSIESNDLCCQFRVALSGDKIFGISLESHSISLENGFKDDLFLALTNNRIRKGIRTITLFSLIKKYEEEELHNRELSQRFGDC